MQAPNHRAAAPVYFSVWLPKRGGREGGQGYQVPGVVAGWVLWVSPSSRWQCREAWQTLSLSSSLTSSSVPQAGGTPPCTAQKGQDEDRDRNAWILKIDQQRGFPAGRPKAPFPEWHQLPFCALKCHPIAQGHQSQKEKAERGLPGALASGLPARAVRLPRLQYQRARRQENSSPRKAHKCTGT